MPLIPFQEPHPREPLVTFLRSRVNPNMSSDRDTDDTDTLLASDPMGGLFLNLSLKQLADKHRNLVAEPVSAPPPPTKAPVPTPAPPPSTSDLSDYFNSDGALVLSGLGEWTDSDLEKDLTSSHPYEEDDGDSDSSFTYKNSPSSSPQDKQGSLEGVDLELDVRPCPHPPQFSNLIQTGRVIDVNLQNPVSGWNLPSVAPSSSQDLTLVQGAGVQGSYLDGSGAQIFTRAPNFRGSSTSQSDPPLGRDLSEAEVLEEVKKMYEEDDRTPMTSEVTPAPKKVVRFPPELEQGPSSVPVVPPFNFLSASNSSPALITFESTPKPRTAWTITKEEGQGQSQTLPQDQGQGFLPPSGRRKHTPSKGKRKLVQNQSKLSGAGDCPGDSPSSLSSGSQDKLEVGLSQPEPPPPSPPEGLILNLNPVPYSTEVVRGQKRNKPKNTAAGFSFGYQSESDLSPIAIEERAASILAPTPGEQEESEPGLKGPGQAMRELSQIWRQIQSHRDIVLGRNHQESSSEEEEEETTPTGSPSSSGKSFIQDLGKGDDVSSFKSKRPVAPPSGNVPPHPSVHLAPNLDCELDALLASVDIAPSDFEDILSNLDLSEAPVGPGIDDLLAQIIDPATSQEARESASLSHWAAAGAATYLEKYYEEKFRRQECEEEIDKLQKELLTLRQNTAVLQGNGRRKDATILKISEAWKSVSSEWKTFEGTTRSEFEALKKEHASLSRETDKDREKLEELETQLQRATRIGEDFQDQLRLKEGQVKELEETLASLTGKVGLVSDNCDKIREEKDHALESLKESQLRLESLSKAHSTLEEQFLSLQSTHRASSSQLEQVLVQNSQLEFLLQENKLENEEAQSKFQAELEQLLTSSAREKASLQLEYEKQIKQVVGEEGERLHSYYNAKVQEALTAAGEKASKAQAGLVESMKKAGAESERKLAEAKIRYHSDLTRIKTIYEVEMQELKKDNLQKQLLISTTAQQLSSGGIVRTETIDRLQNIVSNFPQREHSLLGQGDRPCTPVNQQPTTEQQLSNIRDKLLNFTSSHAAISASMSTPSTPRNSESYAKFVQNLEAKSATRADNLNLIHSSNKSFGEMNKLSEPGTPTVNKSNRYQPSS